MFVVYQHGSQNFQDIRKFSGEMEFWKDEQITSLLKNYKELYVTHINHNNLKVHHWCEIVNILHKKFLTRHGQSTTFNPRLIGLRNITNANRPKRSRLLKGCHRNGHGMINVTTRGKLLQKIHAWRVHMTLEAMYLSLPTW